MTSVQGVKTTSVVFNGPWSALSVPSRRRTPRFSGLPWDVVIARNAVLNRLVIDLIGLEAFSIALARNRFERSEKILDTVFRLTIGWTLPIVSGMAIQSLMNRHFQKTFPKAFRPGARVNPLALPLPWLDAAGLSQRLNRLGTDPASQAVLKATGLKGFNVLTPTKVRCIRQGKLAIIAADMFFMALKGIAYYWTKNTLTEKRSGKKGFSGEFTYTSDAYRQQKTEFYQRYKHRLHTIAAAIGMGANLTLPVLLGMLLRSRVKAAPSVLAKGSWGLISRAKAMLPSFDYTDVIYMTRATILIHALFNWNLGGAITARDNHERREHLLRTGVADVFFFIGDDMIAGQVAKRLQKRYRRQLRYRVGSHWKPIQITHSGPFGLTMATPYHALHQSVTSGALKTASPTTKALIARVGRIQFWSGLLGTALGLGLSVNLLNNWFTWRRVLREQQRVEKAAQAVR